jgi:hypothetical protein
MVLLARIVVVVSGLALIAFPGVVFARPSLAERFLMSFASSARAHYVEMAARLLVGTSLVVLSPAMWPTQLFLIIGWAIVVSSVVLLLMPWQWHHRFGQRVLPTLVRRMKVYAVGVFAFGCLLLYGVFFAGPRGMP